MIRAAKFLFKTAAVVVVLSIPMSIAWDAIFPGKVYFCTDEMGLDYLHPGGWVHGDLEIVDHVGAASSRTMSEPDVILSGWTLERLWTVWSLMFGSSVAIGLLLASRSWLPQRPS